MSLVTQMIVAEKYGVRLTIEQLSEAMGLAKQTIYNQVAKGAFPIVTYVDSGKRWCDYRDVAAYLDHCRAQALKEHADAATPA